MTSRVILNRATPTYARSTYCLLFQYLKSGFGSRQRWGKRLPMNGIRDDLMLSIIGLIPCNQPNKTDKGTYLPSDIMDIAKLGCCQYPNVSIIEAATKPHLGIRVGVHNRTVNLQSFQRVYRTESLDLQSSFWRPHFCPFIFCATRLKTATDDMNRTRL